MSDLSLLSRQHVILSKTLQGVFRINAFLEADRWADSEGVADLIAADLIVETADLLYACWHLDPLEKQLAAGDIFANRSEQEKFVVLWISGSTAHILDLLDFQERNITIQRDREYVVWGNIKKED